MSEIPEDIRKAAEDTLDAMLCECTESCGGTEGLRKDAISKIAAAILAERERCAKFAQDQESDWLQGVKKATGPHSLDYANGRHDGAITIRKLIRGEA